MRYSKNPRPWLFDEPANDLDPDGIRWLRSYLRDYADRSGARLQPA